MDRTYYLHRLLEAQKLQDKLNSKCEELFNSDMERYKKVYNVRLINLAIISNLETIVQTQSDLRYNKAMLELELGEAGVFPKLDYR